FFALACQHVRRQLNDLARRRDERPPAAALPEAGVAAPPGSTASGLTPDGRRMLGAIDGLPEDEREGVGLVGIQGLTHPGAAGGAPIRRGPGWSGFGRSGCSGD